MWLDQTPVLRHWWRYPLKTASLLQQNSLLQRSMGHIAAHEWMSLWCQRCPLSWKPFLFSVKGKCDSCTAAYVLFHYVSHYHLNHLVIICCLIDISPSFLAVRIFELSNVRLQYLALTALFHAIKFFNISFFWYSYSENHIRISDAFTAESGTSGTSAHSI